MPIRQKLEVKVCLEIATVMIEIVLLLLEKDMNTMLRLKILAETEMELPVSKVLWFLFQAPKWAMKLKLELILPEGTLPLQK